MKYYLRHSVGQTPKHEIDAAIFETIRNARESLNHAREIEEKYDLLVSSYISLEEYILTESLHYMVRTEEHYGLFSDLIANLNIRLITLLTAARIYGEQIYGHVKFCVDNPTAASDIIKSYQVKEYDSNIHYSFMEKFRNHVQHGGMPVKNAIYGMHFVREDDAIVGTEYSVNFTASKKALSLNKKVNAAALAKMPETIDLKLATRHYMESLGTIHHQIRQLIEPHVAAARQTIESFQKHASSEVPIESFTAYHVEENGQPVEKITLQLKWDDIRLKLITKNPYHRDLSSRYVSGVISKSQKK